MVKWNHFLPLINTFVQYIFISIYHVPGAPKSEKQITFILNFRELKMW